MKRIQLIFCVETNQQTKTDFQYIMSLIDRFYEYNNGHILIKPVYLGGKGKYSTQKNIGMVNKLITQFGAGSDNSESYVFICIDCDKYDSDPADRQFLTQAEEYCQARQNYDLVWFCRDVEDVFLGHMVADKQKKAEANRFVKNHMIDHIDVHRLTEKKYKAHSSNIRLILDQLLPIKKS